jgi:hypothetical protein
MMKPKDKYRFTLFKLINLYHFIIFKIKYVYLGNFKRQMHKKNQTCLLLFLVSIKKFQKRLITWDVFQQGRDLKYSLMA